MRCIVILLVVITVLWFSPTSAVLPMDDLSLMNGRGHDAGKAFHRHPRIDNLPLMSNEFLVGSRTFTFFVGSEQQDSKVGIYFWAHFLDRGSKTRLLMPVDGYLEVDGDRYFRWRNRQFYGESATFVAPGEHTVTLAVTDQDTVLVEAFQVGPHESEQQGIHYPDQLELVAEQTDALGRVKSLIQMLSPELKNELLEWLRQDLRIQ